MQVNLDKIVNAYSNVFAENMGLKSKENAGVSFKGFFEKSDITSKELGNNYNKLGMVLLEEQGKTVPENMSDMTEDELCQFVNDAIEKLKNLVTDEDYSQYATLGITAEKDDLKTIVTVYERIQIQLMAYGKGSATSLNISDEKIGKIIKSEALASGINMAENMGEIDDNTKEYIIKNGMEPTVENVYKASHASDAGAVKFNKSISSAEWKQLEGQVESFLEKNGIEVTEDAKEAAKWLMEKEIPLTTENLVKYKLLTEVDMSSEDTKESIKANMIIAEAFGMEATKGYVTKGWLDVDTAKEAVETVKNATDEAVKAIVSNDMTLNVSNLKKYEDVPFDENTSYDVEKYNRAKITLLLAKEILTVEGALVMEKLGVDVVHEDLSKIVDMVREEDGKFGGIFLKNPTAIYMKMMTDVIQIMGRMKTIPVAAIGSSEYGEDGFTVRNVYNQGENLKQTYEEMDKIYEAVGTEVRKDLGDDIQKAFENAGRLLEEVGLENTKEYRRAVRILGYNTMEITKEAVIEMANKAMEVDKVMKNITPKTAAYFIENGINPLDMDIEELNEKVEILNQEIGMSETEEYSRYLWKLEKSGKVTKEEKQAYIELYKALKTIEKGDTRAIGAVAMEGAAMTLGNLLKAELSRSKQGLDVVVDDKTGFYQGKIIKNKLADILNNIAAAKIKNGEKDFLDINIFDLSEEVLTPENIMANEALNNSYEAENLREIYKSIEEYKQVNQSTFTEEMLYNILEGNGDINLSNMQSAALLMTKGNEMRTLLNKKMEGKEKLLEKFNSEEEIEEALTDLSEDAESDYIEAMESGEKEVISFRNFNNMTGYMLSSAKNKCYHIPMDVGDDEVLVKVKFRTSKSEKMPSIDISFDSENMGAVTAHFSLEKGIADGYVICESDKIRQHIERNMNAFSKEIDIESRVSVVVNDIAGINVGGMRDESYEVAEFTDKQLYEIAKSFLGAVKVWGTLPINSL